MGAATNQRVRLDTLMSGSSVKSLPDPSTRYDSRGDAARWNNAPANASKEVLDSKRDLIDARLARPRDDD